MRKNLPYDPVKDFAPIALIGRIPEVLVVNAALPIHSIADLATLAKSTPGGLSYASAGAGTGQHLSGVQLASVLGIPMTHVPYKGMSPAINDVAGGHVPLMFSPIPFALPLAQAGKLRMLGVTTAERVEVIPDVPPLTEIGVKEFARHVLVHAGGGRRHADRYRRHASPRGAGASPPTRRCARSCSRSASCRCSRRRRTSSSASCRRRSSAVGEIVTQGRAGRHAIGATPG